MNIAPAILAKQYQRAHHDWPVIDTVERRYALPPFTLYAVGSRETNLTNETGDGGHGHGIWQEDDRTKGREQIIARIDSGDIEYAAEIAAGMLIDLRHRYGDWVSAFNAYNSGQPMTKYTAGGDYGPDVMARLTYLQAIATPPPAPAPPVVIPQPTVVSHGTLGGKPVTVQIVPVPTDASGDGDAPAPAGFLGVSPAGSHDKYDGSTHDTDSLVVPVGARPSASSPSGWLLVVKGGPTSSWVGAPVLVAD